jgi:hypothetical protein
MNHDSIEARTNYLLASTGSVFGHEDFQALAEQIAVHKYLINQTIPWTITWDDAAFSWLENVFSPIMQVIDRWEVRAAFPGMTSARLFFAISDHWYYLLEKDSRISAFHAAIDYAATCGTGLGRLFSKLQNTVKVA